MSEVGSIIFARGFFESGSVHTALAVGAAVAIVSAAVGLFAVIRGQAFAGEALSDIGAAGASGAFLVGAGALPGFLAATIGAAGLMELIGVQRPRGRDLATGIVLGASLGIAALLLYLVSTHTATTGATQTIVLSGSLLAISGSTIPAVVALSAAALALLVLVQRPLLLSSLSPEVAAARGIHVRLIGGVYLLALAVAVALSAMTIGAVLATALLIGPPAAALRLTDRPGRAVAAAALIGVAATWLGVVLAYDSYYWPPHGHGWPVSFFVVGAVLLFYVSAAALAKYRARRVPG